jgi:hypothetical protein
VIDGPEERMHIDRAFQKVSAAVAGKTVTTYVCCAQVYEYKREDDGTTVQSTRPCGVAYRTKSRQLERFSAHLKLHKNLTLITTAETVTREAAIMQKFVAGVPQGPEGKTFDALLISVFARTGWAFIALRDKEVRQLLLFTGPRTLPRADDMPARLDSEAPRLLKLAIAHFKTPTLCMDVGTVFRRYLVFTVVERGRVLITNAVCDSEMPDKRMTIPSVVHALKKELERLHCMDVFPLCVVADNASNMQGAGRAFDTFDDDFDAFDDDESAEVNDPVMEELLAGELPYDDSESGDEQGDEQAGVDTTPAITEAEVKPHLFMLKCVCHVLQLVTKDCESEWQQSYIAATEMRAGLPPRVRNQLPGACDIKWATKYLLLNAMLGEHELDPFDRTTTSIAMPDSVRTGIERAVALLGPINDATNFMQRDSANIFDFLCCVNRLMGIEYPLPARRGTNNEGDQLLTEGKRKFRAALTKRLADVVCPLHLVALYFLPITPRTDVKKEVEDAVERALVKINPSVEWEAFVNAGLPAASADE